jgi:hypothetical protein
VLVKLSDTCTVNPACVSMVLAAIEEEQGVPGLPTAGPGRHSVLVCMASGGVVTLATGLRRGRATAMLARVHDALNMGIDLEGEET